VQPNALNTIHEILARAQRSVLVRQNTVLFAGGLVGGLGSFVYHAIAGRILGPELYGQVAFLIATYAVALTFAVILSLVLARYTASLVASGEGRIGLLAGKAIRVVAIPCLAVVLGAAFLGGPVASFEHMASTFPVLIVGLAVALGWLVAIPRGILQGLMRFKSLALNIALEPIVRVGALWALLIGGYAVSGAMAALVAGMAVAVAVGIYSLRDRRGGTLPAAPTDRMARFPLTAAAGVIGIQLLFNQDVVLAEHYLPSHDGGIYGGLNKIGTIIFYLTLSVSQVLFPRVVDAVARRQRPGQLLLSSAGLVSCLGVAALVVFAFAPGLVISALYGPAFLDATPYVLIVGVIGLALALDNMLVQFLLAVHDFWFMPILGFACAAETALIMFFHAGVGQVVTDVLATLVGLLVLLIIRCYLVLQR
jgi:O-antigen/teichoic acid export membrane protein